MAADDSAAKERRTRYDSIKIPSMLSEDFAYFLGFLLGDGSVGKGRRATIYLVGHLVDERSFYDSFMVPLIRKLFHVNPYCYERRGKQAYALHFKSKSLAEYLADRIGFPTGSSAKCVPSVIDSSSLKLRKAFIRGLFDADGCLSFSKSTYLVHKYPSIQIKNKGRALLASVSKILEGIGFRTTLGKSRESWVLAMNGMEMLELWMTVIGTSNEKHLSKYHVWKKLGFCPPGTTTPQRIEILGKNPSQNQHAHKVRQRPKARTPYPLFEAEDRE